MSTTASDMQTRMALIEKEFGMVHGIFQRFESALEKMSEVSTTVQKLLAVHDQRIGERERSEATIFENLERRRDEYARHAERVSHKMDEMAMELRKEIKEELTDLGDSLKGSLKEMQESQKELVRKIEKNGENADTKFKEMESRVRDLERWRWLMVGGGGVLGFVVAKWSFIASMLGIG